MIEENFKVGISLEVDQTSLESISKQVEKTIEKAFAKGFSSVSKIKGALPSPATMSSASSALSVSAADIGKEVAAAVSKQLSPFEKALQNVSQSVEKLNKTIQAGPQKTAAPARPAPTKATPSTAPPAAPPKPPPAREAERKQPPAPGVTPKQLQASLDNLQKLLVQRLGPELAKKIKLPEISEAQELRGAAGVKTASGKTKFITREIEVIGEEVVAVRNTIDSIIKELTKVSKDVKGVESDVLTRAAGMARTRPESATGLVSSIISKRIGQEETVKPHKVMEQVSRAGKATVIFRPDESQFNRMKAAGEERLQILELNRILSKLAPQLNKLGVRVATSVGLAEGAVGKAQFPRRFPKDMQPSDYMATLPVQTLPIASYGFLGAGGVNPARMFQPTQIREMLQGTTPRVTGAMERSQIAAGSISPRAGRELRTALIDMPDVAEDMILVTADAAAKMETVKREVLHLKEAASGLAEGMELAADQLMGKGFEEEDLHFGLKGTRAKVAKIEKVVENGLESVAVHIDEVMPFVTGSKVTTRGGYKGKARVVPEGYLGTDVGGRPIEAAMSIKGAMKRLDLRTIGEALVNEMADVSGRSSQELTDLVENAVVNLGMSLSDAVTQVAKDIGIKDFTGLTTVKGGLIGRGEAGGHGALVGGVQWGALGEGRERPFKVESSRFVSRYDVDALKTIFKESGAFMQQLAAGNEKLRASYQDLIRELEALSGEVDVSAEGLKEFRASAIKPLPKGQQAPEAFAGTLLDQEALKEAFVMQLPTAAGGTEKFRVPGLGVQGGRGFYRTETGLIGANEVAKDLEALRLAAVSLEAYLSGLSGDNPEATMELQERAARKFNDEIQKIENLRKTDAEKANQAAESLYNKFKELADMSASTDFLKTLNVQSGKVTTPKEKTVGEYLESRPHMQSKLYGLRDVLFARHAEAGKDKRFQAIPSAGQLFNPNAPKDIDRLRKAIDMLGISAEQDAEGVEAAAKRLQEAKERFTQNLIRREVVGKGGGSDNRSLMAALGGSTSISPYASVVSVPTSRKTQLAAVEASLKELAAQGHDTAQALSLVEKARSMEPAEALPPGTVGMHKGEMVEWGKAIAKELGIPLKSVMENILGGRVLTHRYPTTGGASFVPAEIMPSEAEEHRGVFRLPSVPTMMAKEEEEAMLAPILQERQKLMSQLEQTKGRPDDPYLRGRVKELDKVIDGMLSMFHHASQNLDYDGDAIVMHAGLTKEAAQEISDFSQRIYKEEKSIGGILTRFRDKMEMPFQTYGLQDMDEAMKRLAKGRVYREGQKGTTLREDLDPADIDTVRKLITPKLATGLTTDAYNQLQVLLGEGLETGGEIMAEGIKHLMLNINTALAAKHVVTGETKLTDLPAFKLLDTLKRSGGAGAIEERMGPGGEYESLGRANQELMAKRRDYYKLMDPAELSKRAGKEVTTGAGGNWESVIEELVQKENIPSFFKRVQEILLQRYAEALVTSGEMADPAAARAAAEKAFQGKKGLDFSFMERHLAPQTFATRQRGIEGKYGIAQLNLNDLLAEALDRVRGATFSDDPFAAGPGGPRDPFDAIREGLLKLFSKLQGSFKTMTQGQFQQMMPEFRGQAAPRGMMEGGQVFLSAEKTIGPLLQAISQLSKIRTGDLQATPELLDSISKSISNFTQTLTHENMHKVMKTFKAPITEFTDALINNSGPIGESAQQIEESLLRLRNVRVLKDWVKKVEEAMASGQKTLTLGGKRVRVNDRLLKNVRGKYQDIMAEEALASSVQPEKFAALFGNLPEAAQEAIRALADRVKERLPSVEKAAYDVGERLTTSLIESLRRSMGVNMDDLRREASERTYPVQPIPETFPGKDRLGMLQERRRLYEESLIMARKVHRLTPGKIAEGGAFGTEPVQELVGDPRGRIKSLIEEMYSGAPFSSPESDVDFRSRFREEMSVYQAALKRMEKEGSGVSAFLQVSKVYKEYEAARLQFLINEARRVNDLIEELKSTGRTGTSQFADLLNQLGDIDDEVRDFLTSTLQRGGRGKGQARSIIADPQGNLFPPAIEAGIKPVPATFRAAMSDVMGRGEGEATKFEPVAKTLWTVLEQIQKGADYTETWGTVLQELIKYPKGFATNLGKAIELMARWTGLLEMSEGRSSAAARNMSILTKEAKVLDNVVKRHPITDEASLLSALHDTKSTKTVTAMGLEGVAPASSIEAQIKQQRALYEQMALTMTDVYKKTGMSTFQTQKFDIIDPKSGKAIQQWEAQFVRSGKAIKVVFDQIGTASKQTSKQLQLALRRVVQWGFATGIIYGTMRAFRMLVTTIADVQTGMTELKKVMDTTITDFDQLQASAIDMAKEFGVPLQEVIAGMEVYGQQGLKVNEVLELTRSTLLAVNVTTLKAEEATEALTAAQKIFGDEMANSTGFVDAWGAVAAKHAVTAKDLAQAVQRSGAAAMGAGVNFHDFMGIVTAIGATTRKTGKEVGTTTKFMFKQFATPKAQKTLGQLGIENLTAGGDLRPAMDVLKDISAVWGDLMQSQKLAIAQSIAGTRHYNDFMVLMEQFDEALAASANSMNSQGFAMRKNDLAMETLSKQYEVFRQTITGLAVEMGNALIPTFTTILKVGSSLFEVLSMLPGPLFQMATVGVAGLIGLHRAADFLLDTFVDMAGATSDVGENLSAMKGRQGALRTVARAPKAAISGLFAGISAVGDIGEGARGAGLVTRAINAPLRAMKDWGMAAKEMSAYNAQLGKTLTPLQKGLQGVGTALVAMGTAGRFALLATGIGVAVAAITLLIEGYNEFTKTGKDVEDSLYNQIGQSLDLASQLEAQGESVNRVTLAYKKYEKSVKTFQGNDLGQKIVERSFVSPIKALKDYQNLVQEIAMSTAKVSPTMVEGISETGEYLVRIDAGLQSVAKSAADAQKAIAATFQTNVIKAYAEEITKPKGFKNIAKTVLSFGLGEFNLAEDLKKATDRVNKLAEQRRKLTEEGSTTLGMQTEYNDAVREQISLNEKALGIAMEMRRVLEEMPVIGDTGLAASVLSGPDLNEALRTGIGTGAFGRGATLGSVQFRQMAKSFGMGGMFDMTTAASPALLQQAFLDRGVLPTAGGAGAQRGDVAIASRETAEKLIGGLLQGMDPSSSQYREAINAARTFLVDVDDTTGETIYRFWNGATETWQEASGETAKVVREGIMGIFSKTEVAQEMEKTKKLLTLQFTGALAGIRIPEGTINLGPARKRELTAEQRAFSELAIEMDRLSMIQAELTQITRKYNEELEGSETEEAYKGLSQNSQKLAVLLNTDREMIANLMREGFELTALGHASKAAKELDMMMEKLSQSLSDAAIEAKTAAEFMTHTSGALAGQAVLPTLDLGKSMRELSGQERLQATVPGFGRSVQRLALAERQKDIQIQAVTDLRKQRSLIDEMVSDLEAQGKALDDQLTETLLKRAKTLTPEQLELIRSIEQSDDMSRQIMETQLSVQEQMLEKLGIIAEAQAIEDPKERAALVRGKLSGAENKEIFNALGGALGPGGRDQLLQDVFGIVSKNQEGLFGNQYTQYAASGTVPIALASPDIAQGQKDAILALREQFIDLLNRMELAPDDTGTKDLLRKRINEIQDQLLQFGPIGDVLKGKFTQITQTGMSEQKEVNALKAQEERAAVRAKYQEQIAALYSRLQDDENRMVEGIRRAADILGTKDYLRLAVAADEFGKGLDDIITGFKKAEATQYAKLASDLEGPWARVGQPGFRTQFENKRRDLEDQYSGRPVSLAEMRERDKAFKDLEFEEKEAKIKATQDIEVSALRQQQGQAEQVMNYLADQLFSGALEGTGLEGESKRMIETLRQELSTSEQAEMRGGELFFKGIPSLDEVRKLSMRAKEEAKTKADQAQSSLYRESITDPLAGQLQSLSQAEQKLQQQQISILGDIRASLAKQGTTVGSAGATYGDLASRDALAAEMTGSSLRSFAPTGLVSKGAGTVNFNDYIPVGRSNLNQHMDAMARASSGNATASTSAIITTQRQDGTIDSSGSTRAQERTALRGDTGTDATQQQNETILSALEGLNETIRTLASEGIRLPDSFTESISSVGEVITNALGETLQVEVINAPEVTVSNISEITDALDGLSSVGSELADVNLRLASVESSVNSGGSIDARIDEVRIDLGTVLSDTAAALTTQIEGLSSQVSEVEEELGEVVEAAATATDTISEFDSRIVDAETLVSSLETQVADASALAQEAIDSTSNFSSQLDNKEQGLIRSISDVQVQVDDLRRAQQSISDQLGTVQTFAKTALNRAEQAINSAMTSKRV